MSKIPSSDGFADSGVVFPTGSYFKAISIKDSEHLFPDVLCFLKRSGLDVVITAPNI
jgi:hypothetical protein